MTTTSKSVEVRVIDALATDLEDNAGLPQPHFLAHPRRPLIVIPQHCPLLCLWLVRKTFVPQGTEDYNCALFIGISWQNEVVQSYEELERDQDNAEEMLDAMAAIEKRLIRLSSDGWDPSEGDKTLEAYEVYPVAVDYLPPADLESGFVEGYAMTAQVSVVQRRRPTP